MIFLLPVVLAVYGLTSGRNGLVWLAVAIFAWLSWGKQNDVKRRRASLFALPTTGAIKVDEFGGRNPEPAGPGCGCA